MLFAAVLAGAVLVFFGLHFSPIKVTRYIPEKSAGGYTLIVQTADDIGQELEQVNHVLLVDMEGKTVHSWPVLGSVYLAKLKPDGNLVYSTRDRSFVARAGVREIDPFGNVLWYYPCRVDHDFSLLDDGNLLIHYVEDKEIPEVGPGIVRSGRIVEVTPEKQVVWRWAAEDHLAELTDLAGLEFPRPRRERNRETLDWAHNNTAQVIGDNPTGEADPRFRRGNILFSDRHLDIIGVIDRESGRIVWAWGPGELDGPHNPTMLRNGHLLIFDNGPERGYSRVIEVDPLTMQIVWAYSGQTDDPGFFSPSISSAQGDLPRGNVFIDEGYNRTTTPLAFLLHGLRYVWYRRAVSSRLIEVTRDKEIVWECIVTGVGEMTWHVYQATRYSPAYVRPLLEAAGKSAGDRRLRSLPYVQ